MSKELTLKSRQVIEGVVRWHDAYVLQVAIENISSGKSFSKAALWLSVAGKIQYALLEDDDFSKQDVPDKNVTVTLKNVEARKLWQELVKLKPEQFGKDRDGNPISPNPGILYLMFSDIAQQLGFDIEDEDEEDDN